MNRLDPPAYTNDAAALDLLATNNRLKCYPDLAAQVPSIKQAYGQYLQAHGNAHSIDNVALPENIQEQLESLYSSPSKELPHINRIREESDANCCPMCGSFHSGTLDHLLPKSPYSVFAIFGPNLVPACKCNSKRSNLLKGATPYERILHPYFDDVLSQRLILAHIEDLGPTPRISLRHIVDAGDPMAATVAFHIANVVERTSILRYMRKSWSDVLRRPSLAAAELRSTPQSHEALVDIISAELDRQDDTHGSRNNWRSVFLAGLLETPVVDWLFAAFHRPGRADDDPLLHLAA